MQKQMFCQLLYILMMTLTTVSMVEIIIMNEKPGSILRGTENERLSLECTVNVTNTWETLIWQRNGRILANDRHGYALFSFLPTKKDHMSEFRCEVHDIWKGKIKEKVITLDIKYKPVLEFNFTEKSLFIKGETKTLCCTSDSNPSTYTMVLKTKRVSEEVHKKSNACLTLMNIGESNSEKYSCFAENEIGFVEQEINLNVLYPPVFVEEHKIIQFGKLGERTKIRVIAHTISSIVCCHIEGANRRQIPPDMEIISKNTTHPFHGTNTIVEELEIAVSFIELQSSDFQNYKITLCNHDGNSSCIVELKHINTDGKTVIITKVGVVTGSLFLVLCVVISGMKIFHVKKRKSTHKDNRKHKDLGPSYQKPINHVISNRKQKTDTYSEVWC